MPGTTALASTSPEPRAGAEVHGAIVPGFYLSNATQQDPDHDHLGQLAVMFEGGDLVSAPGLGVGGRWVSGGDDTGYFEPMIRYRWFLDDDNRLAMGLVAFGTVASGEAHGASYSVGRGGLELGTDIRATAESRWLELHLIGGASITAIGGDGTYCMNADSGYGIDCDGDQVGETTADLTGVYPASYVGLGFVFARHLDIALHDIRLDTYLAGGTLPRIRFAELSDSPESWFTWGASLSFGFGDTGQEPE
jgi:hypothetical protein